MKITVPHQGGLSPSPDGDHGVAGKASPGSAALRSLFLFPLIPGIIAIVLSGAMGRGLAILIKHHAAAPPVIVEAFEARELPPQPDEPHVRETFYQHQQEENLRFDPLSPSHARPLPVRWANLEPTSHQTAVAKRKQPTAPRRPQEGAAWAMPFFDVDSACAALPANRLTHECIAHEQRSYDAILAAWDDLTHKTRETCVGRVKVLPTSNHYSVLEQCVKLETTKEELQRKPRQPPPRFDYRGAF